MEMMDIIKCQSHTVKLADLTVIMTVFFEKITPHIDFKQIVFFIVCTAICHIGTAIYNLLYTINENYNMTC